MTNNINPELERQIEEHNQYYSSFIFNFYHLKYFNTNCWRNIFLTLNFLGIQFAWSVELSYGTNYLLSLGLSKSQMSLVWLAGPISGLVMQPLIGAISDRSQFSMGRRRPFMLLGSIGILIALFMIGWTKDIVQEFQLPHGSEKGLAIFAFFLLDFAINAVQACARALLVDILPPSYQENGNAWAARMIGFGNIFGYLMGYLNLPKLLPLFGDKQLQVLCGLTIVIVCFTVGLTCGTVIERQWIKENPLEPFNLISILVGPLVKIYTSFRSLKPTILSLCFTQFFSWIGWFPFLFYATNWITELDPATATKGDKDDNSRLGSRAFLFFSITSLITTFVIPHFLKNHNTTINSDKRYRLTLAQWFTISLSLFGLFMLVPLIFKLNVLWATILVTFCGVSNALSMWAPFSIIGEELRNLSQYDYIPLQNRNSTSEIELPPKYSQDHSDAREGELEAGVVLGIHNLFIVIPQILISFVSSFLFGVLNQKEKLHPSPTEVVFALGGISSIIAAFISLRIWRK